VIKKLFHLVTAVLALNFIMAAGGIAFLVATGKLDKLKVQSIRDVITGVAVAAPATQPSTQPADAAAQEPPELTPMMRLEAALAQASGRTAVDTIDAKQTAVDQQTATLERRAQEIEAQRRQLDQARIDLQNQREKLTSAEKTLTDRTQEQAKLASDEGFQKSLAVYKTMQAKRVKAIFSSTDDETVVRYLQAMEPRQVASVLKEFKTPEETIRARTLLEKMRQAQQATAQ